MSNQPVTKELLSLLSLTEEWKPVLNYEDSYAVSNTGRVRSLDRIDSRGNRRKGRELRPSRTRDGHLQVVLSRDGKRKCLFVHRLMAEAFYGPIPDGLVVRHIYDVPDQNLLPLLAVGTAAENMADKVRNGRCAYTNLHGSKTHCPRGHALTEGNLRPSQLKRGFRSCLACARAHSLNHAKNLGYAVDSPEFKALSDEYYAAAYR